MRETAILALVLTRTAIHGGHELTPRAVARRVLSRYVKGWRARRGHREVRERRRCPCARLARSCVGVDAHDRALLVSRGGRKKTLRPYHHAKTRTEPGLGPVGLAGSGSRDMPAATAVCIVGAPRTFPIVAETIRNAIKAVHVDVDFFFVLRLNAEAQHTSKTQVTREQDLPFDWVDIQAAIGAFKPHVAAVLNSSTTFVNNPNCPLPAAAQDSCDRTRQPAFVRMWETMIGFRECFSEVKNHEATNNRLYRAVIRLRTDTLFYGPLDPALLTPTLATFPRGHMGCIAPCVNDHLAFMPRAVAHLYFEMADRYVHCRDTSFDRAMWKSMGKHWSISRLIVSALNASHPAIVPWRHATVPYTLARTGSLLATSCQRAGITNEEHAVAGMQVTLNSTECLACATFMRSRVLLSTNTTPQLEHEVCQLGGTAVKRRAAR